ncbi:MAG: ketoacyl-ACP synthase III [Burkholderiales bacterium]
MALTSTPGHAIRAISTAVPGRVFENERDAVGFERKEIDAVVKMVGVKRRHLADDAVCGSDLCRAAAQDVLGGLGWDPASVDGVIMVTQSPDYFQPSTACLLQRDLGLSDSCAAFDVGLGCSGYTYGLWLAGMMLRSPGFRRVLLLHGETPTRFCDPADRSVGLLFGDAGSATAIEATGSPEAAPWWFSLHTDGAGYDGLIIEAGGFRDRFNPDRRKHFLRMNGAAIMNFTLRRIPSLVADTLAAAGIGSDAIDYFILHQSNRFIMRHLATKCAIAPGKMPMTLEDYGNTGGVSVPLTVTQGRLDRPRDRSLSLLMLGYGVGLSWGSALVDLPADARLNHLVVGG